MSTKLKPLRGFRDLYPKDKTVQNYIFAKLRQVANLFGFEEYEGPSLEPIGLYWGKTSKALIDKQTFKLEDKKGQTIVLRPEITPTLARMVAQKQYDLTLPARMFNLGARFRYEAPQRGRTREFYQADFDILGEATTLSEVEILNVAVNVFLSLGAKQDDFIILINSRQVVEEQLKKIGLTRKKIKEVIRLIDKKEKVSQKNFQKMLIDVGLKGSAIKKIEQLLQNTTGYQNYFSPLLQLLDQFGIKKYIKINPSVVRGLDYYTGLVFEAREKGGMKRALLGGGRYDNLVADLGAAKKIPGVGFATSDVILEQFLTSKKLLPQLESLPTKVLVTIFSDKTLKQSTTVANLLRTKKIPSELFLNSKKSLDKQLAYANKKKIPYVIIIGPDEMEKKVIRIKDMRTGEQYETDQNSLPTVIKNF